MLLRVTSLLIVSCLIISCTSKKPIDVVEENLKNIANKKEVLNFSELYKHYPKEKEYLEGQWPPKYGLALSGGGTRSASYSIGVLKALHQAKILDEIDVISAVSGGSYATYWFFSQQFYKDIICNNHLKYKDYCFSNDDIFRQWSESQSNLDNPNQYRFQYLLEESSNILNHAHKPSLWNGVKNKLQLGFEATFQVLSIPLNWGLNGLFDTEINVTPFFYYYKDGLDRTYGYVPLDYTLENFANSDPENAFFGLVKNIDAIPLTFDDMRSFLETRKQNSKNKAFPYFIINTTARFGRWANRYGKSERSLENSTLEFTPFGCYSELIQGSKCPTDINPFIKNSGEKPIDFAKAVAFSGAALDGQFQTVNIAGDIEDPYELPIWLSGKNIFELGFDIANLNLGHNVPHPNRNKFHSFIHKMLPWPLYIFDDWLLWDDNVGTSLYLSDGGHSENLGVFSLIKRGVKNIIIVDAEQDGKSLFSSAKFLEKSLNKYGLCLELAQKNGDLINVYNSSPKKSSFRGSIVEYQSINSDCKANKNLISEVKHEILYIKLASVPRHINSGANHVDPLPFSVRKFQEKHTDFPHDSTADVFYSRDQYRAYRDLGFVNTKEAIKKWLPFFNSLNN